MITQLDKDLLLFKIQELQEDYDSLKRDYESLKYDFSGLEDKLYSLEELIDDTIIEDPREEFVNDTYEYNPQQLNLFV